MSGTIFNQACIHWMQDAVRAFNRDHTLRDSPRVPDVSLVGSDGECMDYAVSATRSDLTPEQVKIDREMFAGFKGFVVAEDTEKAMTSLQAGIDNYVKLAQTMHSPLLPDGSISTDTDLSIQALQARDRRRNERFLQVMALPLTNEEQRDSVAAILGYPRL